MTKPGRNDPCPCGSGKKFKKCCETRDFGKRFSAAQAGEESAPEIRKTAKLTSLFHARLSETPKKLLPPSEEEKPGSEKS